MAAQQKKRDRGPRRGTQTKARPVPIFCAIMPATAGTSRDGTKYAPASVKYLARRQDFRSPREKTL